MSLSLQLPPRHQQRLLPALFLFFTLLIGTVPTQARSLEDIYKSKELRVCIAFLSPAHGSTEPANCRENCKLSGPIYDEIQAFTNSLGRDVRGKFLRINWDEQFFNKVGKTIRETSYTPELLATGQCDIYPNNLTKNEWRLKKIDFVVLFPSRMMVISKQGLESQMRSLLDLAGKKVAVEKNTSFHTWIQEQNRAPLANNPIQIELMSSADSLDAVDTGKVDFTLLDSDMAMWSARHQLKNATVAFPIGTTEEIGWAFRKEDKDLQAAAQNFFDQQRKNSDTELNRIWKKYFGRTLNEFVALMMSMK
ncbi:transporter substrate-binding domain-containing protein [Undibacterium sp.]|uniref:transporter substrate-binding domain-containing protein n=1 Tax=Undibacterium sp. TaxID=1914977 RepID=UPI0025CEAFB3|nr:transporter substrate-binding domain-containing protein [Undibacterium sp.]MCX7217978.1 transporter substrate-binding domain-containing protein [Burkholderiales bacterium]